MSLHYSPLGREYKGWTVITNTSEQDGGYAARCTLRNADGKRHQIDLPGPFVSGIEADRAADAAGVAWIDGLDA